MSGEAVVSEIMRAYRTIDALTAENARLSDRLTAAMEGGRAERPDILSDKLRALGHRDGAPGRELRQTGDHDGVRARRARRCGRAVRQVVPRCD